jgi:mono/diheme cytochrome c family protein
MRCGIALAALLVVAIYQAAAATPEDTYLETCAICHGADGGGQTARGKKLKLKDLRSAEVQKLPDAQLTEIIAKGKGRDMPPYEQELGQAGVAGQVAHVRALAKKK